MFFPCDEDPQQFKNKSFFLPCVKKFGSKESIWGVICTVHMYQVIINDSMLYIVIATSGVFPLLIST